jgi:hypothetical protein
MNETHIAAITNSLILFLTGAPLHVRIASGGDTMAPYSEVLEGTFRYEESIDAAERRQLQGEPALSLQDSRDRPRLNTHLPD